MTHTRNPIREGCLIARRDIAFSRKCACADCAAGYQAWLDKQLVANQSHSWASGAEPDQVMVEHLVKLGPHPLAKQSDRRAAIEILLKQGRLTHNRIALRVGVNVVTVGRVKRNLSA